MQNCKLLLNIPIVRSMIPSVTIPPLKELEKLASTIPIEFNGMILGGGGTIATNDNNNTHHQRTKSTTGKEFSTLSNHNLSSNSSVHSNGSSVVKKPSRGWNDTSEIPIVLKEVCSRLARNPELAGNPMGPNENELYVAVLLRLAKLQSAQDSQYQLTNLLACPPDLSCHVPKKPWKPLGKTQIWLYVSNQNIHLISKSQHAYGLFRSTGTTTTTDSQKQPPPITDMNKPWIGITATVHERINLTTLASVDRISLQIHEDKYSL